MNSKSYIFYISLFFSLSIQSAQSSNFDEDSKGIRKAVLKPVGYMWKIISKLPVLPSQSSNMVKKTVLAIEFEQAYLMEDTSQAATLIAQNCIAFDEFFDQEQKTPLEESSIIYRYKTCRCTPQDRQFLEKVACVVSDDIQRSSQFIKDIRALTAKKNV